jgi:hypothetical protein
VRCATIVFGFAFFEARCLAWGFGYGHGGFCGRRVGERGGDVSRGEEGGWLA